MEFNTQICTTREQSKRLLAMGLNPETADMHWHYTNSRSESLKWRLEPYGLTTRENFFGKIDRLAILQRKRTDGTPMTGDEVFEEIWGKDIPAWSLHRLLAMIYRPTMACMLCRISYDNIIEQLEADIACGFLEPKYLTDKKEGK